MKKVITIAAAMLFWQSFFAQQPDTLSSTSETETYVYICTGGSSKRYHKSPSCKGLDRCSKDIKKVTLSYAEDNGRTPCKVCHKH